MKTAVKPETSLKKFQIRYVDKDGCGRFLYFDSDGSDKEQKACEKANEDLQKQRQRDAEMSWSPFHQPHKPFRTLQVVEYDKESGGAKRGGIKFKIRLNYFEATFTSGKKVRDEWYESDQ